ncbi:MAG: hypothetical protein JWO81_1921 [Alphaproteobacteria bacterium]|nr:hypothetical protein [Alphaproteobacteria bacterium]
MGFGSVTVGFCVVKRWVWEMGYNTAHPLGNRAPEPSELVRLWPDSRQAAFVATLAKRIFIDTVGFRNGGIIPQ